MDATQTYQHLRDHADFWIRTLNLEPHPEGGYFREIFRSEEYIHEDHLPSRYNGHRNFLTAIYYLLRSGQCSRFHRLQSDEVWHYCTGSPLRLYIIHQNRELETVSLGPDPHQNHVFQFIVPKESWLGAHVTETNSYSLISCIMAPGFDYQDFELGSCSRLLDKFPEHREIIKHLT